MKTIAFIILIALSFPVYSKTIDAKLNDNPVCQDKFEEKSYFVAVPLALIVGFGSGHFYAKDKWGGIRYIAYDLAGIGLGFLTLYLNNYSSTSIIFALAIATVNRIYQSISAAESVYYYNREPLLREINIFELERPKGRLTEITQKVNTLQLELINF